MTKYDYPDAPRCPICGKYMERVSLVREVIVYSCCGVEKQKLSPSESLRDRYK